jgi:hypothetical protein
MVRALVAGTKTQTRRVVKPQPRHAQTLRTGVHETSADGGFDRDVRTIRCPYGGPGDRLWVRETFYCDHWWAGDFEATRATTNAKAIAEWRELLYYRADGEPQFEADRPTWRSPIHMPRWASRVTLEVTGVRVERVQSISEDDARAEGVPLLDYSFGKAYGGALTGDGVSRVPLATAREAFADLWREINGAASWDANPWCWVLEFKRVEVDHGHD